MKSINLKDTIKYVLLSVGWLLRRIAEALLFTCALVGLGVLLGISFDTLYSDVQDIAFMSQSAYSSGVAHLWRLLKYVCLTFFIVSCVFHLPVSKAFNDLAKKMANSFFDRFVDSGDDQKPGNSRLSFVRHYSPHLVVSVLVIAVICFAIAADRDSSSKGFIMPDPVSSAPVGKKEVKMILPDGRKIVGAGFAMINNNRVEVTYNQPVEPFK